MREQIITRNCLVMHVRKRCPWMRLFVGVLRSLGLLHLVPLRNGAMMSVMSGVNARSGTSDVVIVGVDQIQAQRRFFAAPPPYSRAQSFFKRL